MFELILFLAIPALWGMFLGGMAARRGLSRAGWGIATFLFCAGWMIGTQILPSTDDGPTLLVAGIVSGTGMVWCVLLAPIFLLLRRCRSGVDVDTEADPSPVEAPVTDPVSE